MAAILLVAPGVSARANPLPGSTAVFPFQARRSVDKEGWLARFLEEEVRDSLLRTARVAVLSRHAAVNWQRKLKLKGMEAASPERTRDMGVERLVSGTAQLVLKLGQIQLRVTGPDGRNLFADGVKAVVTDMSRETPLAALKTVLRTLGPALGLELHPPKTLPGWPEVRAFYSALVELAPENTAKQLDNARTELERLSLPPGLRKRGAEHVAKLWLREAVLVTKKKARRELLLRKALGAILRTQDNPPWHAGRMALKGEILYFLKQDFEAKTETSVARIKNPLDGLAHAVSALVAGLSTGEAADHMKAALRADPFLSAKGLPTKARPFQGGVLEPLVSKWEALRKEVEPLARRGSNALLREGIAHFEKQRWDQAEKTLLQAAEQKEYDYVPLLYLARIQIETGQPENAVRPMRRLADEFPQEWEIHYHLGIALELSESFGAAVSSFERALKEDQHRPEVLYHLATSLMGLRRWGEAREKLANLLNKEPTHERGWLAFGVVHARMGEWSPAYQAFGKVLELNPNSLDARAWRERARKKLPSSN